MDRNKQYSGNQLLAFTHMTQTSTTVAIHKPLRHK